ncbi:MAG: hypothetical protein JNK56_18420 [Myxococcales bacterium]|nr:hypothetical protein [Myxococcales bacterium]
MLALLLRSSVALALIAPPPPVSPQSREYAGAEASEGGLVPDASADGSPGSEAEPIVAEEAAIVPPAPAEVPAVQPAPAEVPAVQPATTALVPEGPAEDEDSIDELPYDPLIDSPEAIRARHWVRSGAVFVALGAALTIGAIAMSQAKVNVPETGQMDCNSRGDPAGNGCTKGGRARATAALAVPGALLLGGGVAMITVGKLQQRRLAASVRADRQSFAVGLSWRF